MDKPVLFWVQDSGGVNTCHVNGVNLSFNDSLIGRLASTGKGDDTWHVILKDNTDLGGFPTVGRAMKAMEEYYCRSMVKSPVRKPERR